MSTCNKEERQQSAVVYPPPAAPKATRATTSLSCSRVTLLTRFFFKNANRYNIKKGNQK